MHEIIVNLLIAFVGAFVGAWLSTYLTGAMERKRDRRVADECITALREVTKRNLDTIEGLLKIQSGEGFPPNQVLPALHVSIYEALLPQLPAIRISHHMIVEVAKTYGLLKDMQELHYTILNLNLSDIAPMRDAIRRSEPVFTGEVQKQLNSLMTALN